MSGRMKCAICDSDAIGTREIAVANLNLFFNETAKIGLCLKHIATPDNEIRKAMGIVIKR